MKTCPIVKHFCHSRIIILPNTKQTLKNLTKTFKIVPTWWNFAKSGHTVARPQNGHIWDFVEQIEASWNGFLEWRLDMKLTIPLSI